MCWLISSWGELLTNVTVYWEWRCVEVLGSLIQTVVYVHTACKRKPYCLPQKCLSSVPLKLTSSEQTCSSADWTVIVKFVWLLCLLNLAFIMSLHLLPKCRECWRRQRGKENSCEGGARAYRHNDLFSSEASVWWKKRMWLQCRCKVQSVEAKNQIFLNRWLLSVQLFKGTMSCNCLSGINAGYMHF